MQLIVFSGLQGTGKSTLAEALGRQLSIPVYSVDWIEATLQRCGLEPRPDGVPDLGYAAIELMTTLAGRRLRLEQSVILDSVARTESIRARWRDLARESGAAWRVIECRCSDVAEHRRRIATRQRGIPGWHELEWSHVESTRARFEPWEDERLVVDTLSPLDDTLAVITRYLVGEQA